MIKESLNLYQYKHSISRRDMGILVECYRRWKEFDKNLDSNIFLPAAPYEVKGSKYVTCGTGREMPRVKNWYKLTEAGKKKMKEIEALIGWGPKHNNILFGSDHE